VGNIQYDEGKRRILALMASGDYATLWSVPDTNDGRPAEQLVQMRGGDFDWRHIFAAAVDPKNQMYYLLVANLTDNDRYYLTSLDISSPGGRMITRPITCESGPSQSGMYPQFMAWDAAKGQLVVASEGIPPSGGTALTEVWTIGTTGTCSSQSFSVLPEGNHLIIDCWGYDPLSRSLFFAVPEAFENPPGSYIEQVNIDTAAISIFATLKDEMFPESLVIWNQ